MHSPFLLLLFLSLLSLAALPAAASDALPHLRISLTPILNTTSRLPFVTALNVTLTFPPPRDPSSPLLALLLNSGATQTLQYPSTALHASDAAGALPLTHADETASANGNAQRYYRPAPGRRVAGDLVTVQFVADPPGGLSRGNGPRIDLRREPGPLGGLVGMGEGFLPRPVPAAGREEWRVTVRWELGGQGRPGPRPGCGQRVRAASSLGEGREVTATGVLASVVGRSYFAVGAGLKRWPSWEEEVAERDEVAMYWMGELPWELGELGARVERSTSAVKAFFGEADDPFRVFWRRGRGGYGGAGGYHSFLLEFAEHVEEEFSAEALQNLISHESIHEYALMNPVRQYDYWYREGVAVYYAVMAPFLAGAVDKGYFVRWMNNNAQAYYTGNTTDLDWQYVLDNYWTSTQLVKTSYFRGFIYLAQVQALIAHATNGTKGLDDVVIELYQRYKARETVQSEQFVDVLGGYIGKTAAETSFEEMKRGRLIVPSSDSLAQFGLKMVRRDVENLELGFSESSFGRGVIVGLVPGSRAEQAGLRDGDEIVRFWVFSTAGESLDNKMKVVVRRQGQEIPILYWPRSYDKVESYQWVDGDTVE
ncbi:Peptidase M61 catalytic domain-containing protein [Madurella fahalii]|uniref:Peptidase M61 catalytic domain-containing protein n=1 Tax=Madurella fahalii TaxID=1157608 RepID=A0ABQ0FWQ8_9PEZI